MKGGFTVNNIEILKGNLLNIDADAIVTPANNDLTPCGGVNKDIFYSAGPGLIKACQNIGHCDTGKSVITCGYDVEVEYIIHTVGPCWFGGYHGEAEILASCYESSLFLAEENEFKTIAFSAIGTGSAKYPIEEAANIALATIKKFLKERNSKMKVYIICNNHNIWLQYRQANEKEDIDISEYFGRKELVIEETVNEKEKAILKKKLFQKKFASNQLTEAAISVLDRVIKEKYKNVILLDELYTKDNITEKILNKHDVAGAYITYDMIQDVQLQENVISFKIQPFADLDFYKK